MIAGKPETNIYSVATGTQGGAVRGGLCSHRGGEVPQGCRACGAVSGREFHRRRASADLPVVSGKPVVPYVQPLTHLGRSSITRGHPFSPTNSRRTAHFRQKVRSAYQRHVMGAQGLMTHIESGVWWRLRDSWNNSKSAGMPLVLLAYRRMSREPGWRPSWPPRSGS